jgi:aminoglycoside phosphotransferase (APT) family kinase protein
MASTVDQNGPRVRRHSPLRTLSEIGCLADRLAGLYGDLVHGLPGVDFSALTKWLDSEHPGLRAGPVTGELITGGKSNLTYRITDGASVWALRRPPLAHVLPSAHDMGREFRVISALGGTDVPVARAIALCPDPAILGAPFYLMSFVDGVVFDQAERLAALTPELAATACEELVDTLLELHSIDPASVGLADFGRPDGYLARQVKRWHAQWQASQTAPRPELDELVERLTATMPAQGTPAIVHGDYRLTNVIYRRDVSGIAAVVDWEMATLGDPLADVGLLAVYHRLAAVSDGVMPAMSPDNGFLSAEQMAARYAAGAGRDLSKLDWYIAFGYYKLAVISEGIHYRYLQGKTVGEGFSQMGDRVPQLLDAALGLLADR